MSDSKAKDEGHSIVTLTVGVVALAIIIITVLTVTAIINGPPPI